MFQSSSDIEDHEHMLRLRREFRIPDERVNTCRSIEEMFAVIQLASEVITDRYHPGVAALIHGVKLTVTHYPAEEIKLKGLLEMQKYSHAEIEDLNDKAFAALLSIIQQR